MSWDWSSPIALGLFVIMAAAGLVLASVAMAIGTGRAKVSDIHLFDLFR